MNDPYTREERIAIRMASGMSEKQAIALTDAKESLIDRVNAMAADQAKKPKHFVIHKRKDSAALASGEVIA